MDTDQPLLKKIAWPFLLVMLLAACSRASVQDHDNLDFVDVAFYGLDSEIIHSITNSGEEIFHVEPFPVIDYEDEGTWREVANEWGFGTDSLGAYPIYPDSTVSIMPYFRSDRRALEAGSYRIRHLAWFGENPAIPDPGDDETFFITVPFEIEE